MEGIGSLTMANSIDSIFKKSQDLFTISHQHGEVDMGIDLFEISQNSRQEVFPQKRGGSEMNISCHLIGNFMNLLGGSLIEGIDIFRMFQQDLSGFRQFNLVLSLLKSLVLNKFSRFFI